MHITVICKTCQKRYKVDAKLGGKKLKCKACGGAVAVPVVEAPAESDDGLMAGLAAAAAAEQQAPAAPAARQSRPQAPRPAPRAPRQPPRMPVAPDPESGGGEMDFAAPPCPRCGRPLAGSVRYCAACGYDRQAAAPVEAAPPAAPLSRGIKRHWTDESQTDSRGFRISQPYANPILEFLDTWVPKAAVWLILATVATVILLLWYGALNSPAAAAGMLSYGRLIGVTFGILIYVGLSMLINLAITAKGIELGAKVMKCHLPENLWSRLLATYLIPGVVALVVMMAMGMGAGVVSAARSSMAPMAIIFAIFSALAAFLVTSFFTFMFFFRLKILENLVCYLFFVIFYVISFIVSWGVFFLISLVLGVITSAGKSGQM